MRRFLGSRRRPAARVLLLGSFVALALLLSTCRRPGRLQAELPDDGPPVTTSQAAALRFVEKVTAAGQSGAESGRSTLTVTEEEATSFLNIGTALSEQLEQLGSVQGLEGLGQLEGIEGLEALEGIEGLDRLRELAGQREGLRGLRPRLSIREPEVRFQKEGRVVVRGYAQIWRWRQPVRIVVAPHARKGELDLDFVEGKLGPVGLPEWLFDLAGFGLSRVILAGQDYAEIDEITVRDGSLTVSGRYDKESLGL